MITSFEDRYSTREADGASAFAVILLVVIVAIMGALVLADIAMLGRCCVGFILFISIILIK